jgi:hypothetical protein
MCNYTPAQRHLCLSKLLLFISALILASVVTHLHDKHKYGGSHSHSLSHKLDADSSAFDASVPFAEDDGVEEDDEEMIIVNDEPGKKNSKSNSNSFSLSKVMKRSRRHCKKAGSFLMILTAVTGVIAGFRGTSRAAKVLMVMIGLSLLAHMIKASCKAYQLQHNPDLDDEEFQHKMRKVQCKLFFAILGHTLYFALAIRFFRVSKVIETPEDVVVLEAQPIKTCSVDE